MSDRYPSDLEITPARRDGIGGISLIWLVPVFAIVISVGMAWRTWSERGPLIEVVFTSAEGIAAGETRLKFRDVDVGLVEAVRFTEDLRNVIVAIRVERDIAPFIDADAQFWVVQPQISAQGVSGLGTLLAGVYIEGSWDERSGAPVGRFTALPTAPLISGRNEGIEFTLSAARGGTISPGAPIIYKGVNVGVIDRPALAEDGSAVSARAFVRAPYDRLVTTTSRFWAASGFSVDFGTEGLAVHVANLTALIQGGIAFDNLGAPGAAVAAGHVFTVHESRNSAGDADVAELQGPTVEVAALFDTSISGLLPGAPVQFDGLTVGSVTGTGGVVTGISDGPPVLLRADIDLIPSRFGIVGDEIEAETRVLLDRLVGAGYRARLTSQGLLGNTLRIDLVQVPDAPEAAMGTTEAGVPAIPVTAPALADVAATARAQLARLDDVPIERLAQAVADLLDNINRVVASDGVREAPDELIGLVGDLRAFIDSDQVGGAVGSAQAAMAGIAAIVASVQDGPSIDNLLAALARSDTIAEAIDRSTAELPALLEQLQALAAEAVALPLAELIRAASGAATAAETLVASDALQAVPQSLAATLAEVEAAAADLRAVTAQVRDSGAVDDLLAALARADAIAASVEAASGELPAVLADLRVLSANAAALPLGTLADQAAALVADAAALAGSEATQALPQQLGVALAAVGAAAQDAQAITARIAEGPAVDALVSALQRADRIAADVETTAEGLPVLLARIDAIAAEAEALPLDELVVASTELVRTADALVGSDETAQIPAALAGALDEVGAALAELRDGDAVQNVNATLAAASGAAAAIADAARGLPELARELEALVSRAEATLASYGDRSEFNAQTLAAIRDLRDTARAVTSLARTIERKPNALLVGR